MYILYMYLCPQGESMSLSDQIRSIALKKHVEPAIRAGRTEFSIAVRELMTEAESMGIRTKQRTPPFCSAIQKQEFLTRYGLTVVTVDGPAKKQSTRVVVHYRIKAAGEGRVRQEPIETPQQRAYRLTEKLRGLLKDELAVYGGGEAFLKWVRSEDDDEEAS
jgi:hypothetical protein